MPPQLILGDCLAVTDEIPSHTVDLICADLPYGTTDCSWDSVIPMDKLWDMYRRVCKHHAAVILTAVQPFASSLIASNPNEFKYDLIWHKSKCGSSFTARYRPLAKHETILIFGNGRITYNPQMEEGIPYSRTRYPGAKNNHNLGLGRDISITINEGTRYPGTVLYFQQKWRRQDQMHPAQKPVELMEYLIRSYSNPGDVVLDNCMGSGSTGVAAVRQDRQFIGIEMNAEYFAIANQRISAEMLISL